MRECAELFESFRKGGGLRAARFRAQRKDYGEFVEDDGGIFDEHGVRQRRLFREGDDLDS